MTPEEIARTYYGFAVKVAVESAKRYNLDPEDCISIAGERLWSAALAYREGKVTNLIGAAVRNGVRDIVRKETAKKRSGRQVSLEGIGFEESVSDVDNIINLATRYRRILRMVFVEGYRDVDAARVLRIPQTTFTNRKQAALREIRDALRRGDDKRARMQA